MEESKAIETQPAGRHPFHQVADKLKRAFLKLGFQLVDDGEGREVEPAEATFATWQEPQGLFGWQSAPLSMKQGAAILRTRLLPAHLPALQQRPPFRLLAFGHVYQQDPARPKRHQMEGLVVDNEQTPAAWRELWQDLAGELFGQGAAASFEAAGGDAHQVSVKSPADGETYQLGYTGPASLEALHACGAGDGYAGWVFVIDVDQLARQYFSLTDMAPCYENDVAFLSRFSDAEPGVGDAPADRASDALRKMGYSEVCGDVLYPADAYIRMNMIQEAWDKNNQGYALTEPLGEFTATRTVLTPAIEKIMGLNYERGMTGLRVFEVGHIFMPLEGQVLPKEHLAVSMGAYGPDVTIETFRKDVKSFLQAMGIDFCRFIPTNVATAYKWNECLVIVGKAGYLDSNFGRISELAARNHGIGVPAYFAQFELNTLIAAAKGRG